MSEQNDGRKPFRRSGAGQGPGGSGKPPRERSGGDRPYQPRSDRNEGGDARGTGDRRSGGFRRDNSGRDREFGDRRGNFDDRRGGSDDRRGYGDRRGDSDNQRGGFGDRHGGSGERRGFDGSRGGSDGRRGGSDDRRGGFGERRGGSDDRRGFGDRRGGSDDRRGGFGERRGGSDDRRGGFGERRGEFGERRGGYERGGAERRSGGPRGDSDRGDFRRGEERSDRWGGEGRGGFSRDRREGDRPARGEREFGGDRREFGRGGDAGRPEERRRGGEGVGRGQERRPGRPDEPALPEDVQASDLEPVIRRDLLSLDKGNAETVARHLVMAARLLDEDPELALAHARAARQRAGRIAVVRETAGVTAYHAGEWAEALSELRTARRMSGGSGLLAVMADCERGLGRPERAIELGRSDEARGLRGDEATELRIVVAGARMDLGQYDQAVVTLQTPDLDPARTGSAAARLFYAYAEALLAADRGDEALQWFLNAAAADIDGETDAEERADELAGGAVADYDEAEDSGGDDEPSDDTR
ncbi:tetratricopeptide repeat protein [Nocardia terpenica]|nr:tetratricopeptide repeat protein [Nocardia terpenica]